MDKVGNLLDSLQAAGATVVSITGEGAAPIVLNGKRVITVAKSVEQAKHEVLTLWTDEERAEVYSFSDLHNLSDANTLGFLCDEDKVLFLDGKVVSDGEQHVAFGNAVQNEVNVWIKEDGHLSGSTCHECRSTGRDLDWVGKRRLCEDCATTR